MLRRALVTDVKPDLNPHLVDDYGSAGISPRHRTRSRPGSCTKDEKLVEGNCQTSRLCPASGHFVDPIVHVTVALSS